MCNKIIRFFTTIIFSLIPSCLLAEQIETQMVFKADLNPQAPDIM